jgi:hypothetical protein
VNDSDYDYDLFISHAGEDKPFVRELVAALQARDLRVWFDETELKVGDSLVRSIDRGLSRSRFGVVVLSPSFFEKPWPRRELDALANRQISAGDEVLVLPIWLDIEEAEIRRNSALLADVFALPSSLGIDEIAQRLEERVREDATATSSRPATPDVDDRLDPAFLLGRLYPYAYLPIVGSDEKALISRVALAARAPTSPQPKFTSATRQLLRTRSRPHRSRV